jgi:SAM-dependent methyltransferase
MRGDHRMTSAPDPNAERFRGNTARFSGFAPLYDQHRPAPPRDLAQLLCGFSNLANLPLVVDLGSGTGLSTRYWADQAEQVIGIEPTADMREQALIAGTRQNITYRHGWAHATGLPNGCATIVACSQALHWMAPQPTFEEAKRILTSGGVFAACDYDWPPMTGHWLADSAFEHCLNRIRQLEQELNVGERLQQWDKREHLARMKAGGCFRYAREALLQHVDLGNSDRLVGLMLSQGSAMDLLKAGLSEQELGIDELRETAARTLGADPRPWFWSARIRMAVS